MTTFRFSESGSFNLLVRCEGEYYYGAFGLSRVFELCVKMDHQTTLDPNPNMQCVRIFSHIPDGILKRAHGWLLAGMLRGRGTT